MALKPVNIRWFRTGSQPDGKIMYSIELQIIFYEYENKNHKINTGFVRQGLCPLGANKTGFNLTIFHFDILRKLYIIRCDTYILFVLSCAKIATN